MKIDGNVISHDFSRPQLIDCDMKFNILYIDAKIALVRVTITFGDRPFCEDHVMVDL